MIKRLLNYIRWRTRHQDAITKLKEKRDSWLNSNHKHMWCDLHGSYNCDHSTWSGESFRKANADAHRWYRNELKKLP